MAGQIFVRVYVFGLLSFRVVPFGSKEVADRGCFFSSSQQMKLRRAVAQLRRKLPSARPPPSQSITTIGRTLCHLGPSPDTWDRGVQKTTCYTRNKVSSIKRVPTFLQCPLRFPAISGCHGPAAAPEPTKADDRGFKGQSSFKALTYCTKGHYCL